MSYEAVTWAFGVDDVTSAELLVLVALAEYYNRDNARCEPSTKTLAERCNLTKPALLRHLRALEDAGYVEKERRTHENGASRSSSYRLPHLEEWLSQLPPSRVTGRNPRVTERNQEGFTALPTNEPVLEPVVLGKQVSPKRERQRDELFELLFAFESGEAWKGQRLTPAARARLNAAARDLREVGATPEQVIERGRAYLAAWPNLSRTAKGLAANWHRLADLRPAQKLSPGEQTLQRYLSRDLPE